MNLSAVLQFTGLIPFPTFTPTPCFWAELEGLVVEISPYEMGRPCDR